ncbi:ABC transporter substrate-binding protein [Cohnella panacarvi]|uniref:ABC transporter substrate-binding protein n=1 Tax=Cohnella panacarvi TaxID=400776 RepID=UPI000479A55C|nr:ABC transporter substrate-binding protein [Cohnella panacarvi]
MTRQRFSHHLRHTSLIVIAVIALIAVQACGKKDNGETSPAAAAASDSPYANVPKTLTYGYIGANKLNLPGGAEGWGLYKGIIQEELKPYGITEVATVGFPNGPDQTEALISGRLDFGSLGDTPAILARSSGAKTRIITQQVTDLIGYLIGKKDGPKTLKDLEGKTIAIQKGSYMHRYIVGLLNSEGIKDVKYVHMLRPDGEAALARGEVDAMTNSGVPSLKLIDQGFPLLDDSSKHPELLGTSTTVVSEPYLEKFPDFPRIWNEARLKALEDAKQHEDEYYEFLAQVNNTTPELVKKVSPLSQNKDAPFTDDGLKLLEGTKGFLVEEKLATSDFQISEWIVK